MTTEKKIENDDPFKLKSSAINALLNEKMKGHTFFISQDSLIIKDQHNTIVASGEILVRGTGFYTLKAQDGVIGDLKYQISPDKEYCTFIYLDGSTILTRKLDPAVKRK